MISNGTDVFPNLKSEKRISIKTNRYCDQEMLLLKPNKKSKTFENINSHHKSETVFSEKKSGIVESKKKRGRPYKIAANHSEKKIVIFQMEKKKCRLSSFNGKFLKYII